MTTHKLARGRFVIILIAVCAAAALALTFCTPQQSSEGSDETASNITVPVMRSNLDLTVSFPGRVQFPNNSNEVFLAGGTVGEVLVEEGDTVEEGQVLARLSSADITGFEAELEQLQVSYSQALTQLDPDVEGSVADVLENAEDSYSDSIQQWLGIELTEDEKTKSPSDLYTQWGLDSLENAFGGRYGFGNSDDNPSTRWNESVIAAWVSIFPGGFEVDCTDDERNIPNQLCVVNEIEDAWITLKNARDSLDQETSLVSSARKALDRATTDFAETELASGTSGRVTDVNMRVGDMVSGDTNILIENTDVVEVLGRVPEIEIGKISPGSPVTVMLNAYAGRTLQGSIKKVGSASGADFQVTVEITAPDDLILREGMNAFVQAIYSTYEGVLLIPTIAVQGPADQPIVMVRTVAGDTPIAVTLGDGDSASIIVESGLSEGQAVVVPLQQPPPSNLGEGDGGF